MRDIAEEVFDVVVVGGGGSGLAAAIEARAAGASVVLLEKASTLGGSTAWSVGSVTATRTRYQLRKGIDDRPEDHWADMAGFNGTLDGRDNPALRRVLADAMPDTFAWLVANGIRFYGPLPEPPHRLPRMHTVLPNSRAFISRLERAAVRAGVVIRRSTRAVELPTEAGAVIGVTCETADGLRRFRARGGVVLTTGDFTNDPDLKERYFGARAARIGAVNVRSTGDGQKLAVKLGARVLNGDLAQGPELRFSAPPRPNLLLRLPHWTTLAGVMAWSLHHLPGALLRPFVMRFVTTALAPSTDLFTEGAILVNRRGERFAEETGKPVYDLPDQPDGIAWIILDRRIAALFSAWPHFISTAPGVAYAYVDDYRRNRPDVFTEADTVEALAKRLGMPGAALAASVAGRNGAGKTLGEGPYIALGPVRGVFVHSEGGVAVDDRHRVLGPDDHPIKGLYAAGSVGQGGLLLKGHGHHLAWAFVSGRRAGRNAAEAVRPQTAGTGTSGR